MGFLNTPPSTEEAEMQGENLDARISLEEKRNLLRDAKKKYGRDFKLHLPKVKSGMDWNALKFKL